MSHFVYILYSEYIDKFYIGESENHQERLKRHLRNHKGFTSRAKDWKIVHLEEYQDKSEALAREKQIKKWKSRKMIENLIS